MLQGLCLGSATRLLPLAFQLQLHQGQGPSFQQGRSVADPSGDLATEGCQEALLVCRIEGHIVPIGPGIKAQLEIAGEGLGEPGLLGQGAAGQAEQELGQLPLLRQGAIGVEP